MSWDDVLPWPDRAEKPVVPKRREGEALGDYVERLAVELHHYDPDKAVVNDVRKKPARSPGEEG